MSIHKVGLERDGQFQKVDRRPRNNDDIRTEGLGGQKGWQGVCEPRKVSLDFMALRNQTLGYLTQDRVMPPLEAGEFQLTTVQRVHQGVPNTTNT